MRVPWPVLIVALALPTAGALVYFVASNPDDPLFRITYAASKVIQFALPIATLLFVARERLRSIRLSFRGVLHGLLVGFLTLTILLFVYSTVFRNTATLDGLVEVLRAKVAGFRLDSRSRFIVLTAFLSIMHSFLEEYYWRWFVHAGLREKLPPWAAIAISSFAFAAHHVVVLHVYFPDNLWSTTIPFSLGVAAGGACWAWLYDRHGSLAGPWLAHVLADVALMAIGYDLLYR
jgi:membrane protease YdiL (CAAX protease family)